MTVGRPHEGAGASAAPPADWLRDPAYLQAEQYRSDQNLAARMALHARFSTSPIDWYAWQFQRMEPLVPRGGHLLEVGCGPAAFWAFNLVAVPPDWSITLTDLSSGMIAAGQQRLGDAAQRFVWKQAPADALPCADASVDVVLAHHMLYHVPDLPATLREFQRVLRPGGVLLAATNGSAHMAEIQQVVTHARVVTGGDVAADVSASASPTTREVFAAAFGLENGAEHLAQVFRDVSLELFPDALRVTDPEALLAFVRSMPDAADLSSDAAAAICTTVAQAIQQHGAFHVSKAGGMFRAYR